MRKQTCTLLFFALLAGAPAALAGPVLEILVNTSSLSGTTGSIDFLFNPGPAAAAANVGISSFVGGSWAGSQTDFGAVIGGPVPAPLTINNTDADNEDLETFTYGASIEFVMTFGGPAITNPTGTGTSGSTFEFSMFSDTAGLTPVPLTSDPNGVMGSVFVTPEGSLQTTAVSSSLNFVPEPGTIWLFAAGALGIVGARMRGRRRA